VAGWNPQTSSGEGGVQAAVGDRIHVHGRVVGQQDHRGRITEVRGPGGSPPYLVVFDDGHEALVFPGPDAVIERNQDSST
jgi:Domain of unknown function (DUF1918)